MPLKKFERRRVGVPASSMRSRYGIISSSQILHLELREVRPEAEVRPAEAEREMPVRLPAEVEPVRIGELLLVVVAGGVPHRHLIAGLDPAAVDRRRRVVAVRRKWCTGCARRRISSAAVPASDGSAISRAISSGWASRSSRPRLIVCRVVSLPGGREEDEEEPELVLGEPRAVELGLDELRRDVVARVGAAGLAEPAAVVDQLERERARERQQADRRIGCASARAGSPRRRPRGRCCRGACRRAR